MTRGSWSVSSRPTCNLCSGTRVRLVEGVDLKGLSVAGSAIRLCHGAEVLTVRGTTITERWTHPWLNDVHHAVGDWVVSTGTDGVMRGDAWMAVGSTVSAPQTSQDLRARDLAPHRFHPNHMFAIDDAWYVTRGMTGDVVSVSRPDETWKIADVVIHDGVVRSDGVWFTAVDGRLLRVNPLTGRVDRIVDLRDLSRREPPLGWCRGLAWVDDVVWVGFTQLRTTRFRRHLAWLRGQLRGQRHASPHPTRVVAYDLKAGREIDEVLTHEVGLDAVFGLSADVK